jgi:hypothetical protein
MKQKGLTICNYLINMKHEFTNVIKNVLDSSFSESAEDIYGRSSLLQYINLKTKSASKGSKSRGSFANLYAIYVLVEDYTKGNFYSSDKYKDYEGAKFSDLFSRQRELPFGSKLQNHALNHRMNQEYKKYFPQSEYIPILRNPETNRYWFNENLLIIKIGKKHFNISNEIINIIGEYMKVKKSAFETFIMTCEKLKGVKRNKVTDVETFILELLQPNADARIFEIASYAILKYYYHGQVVYFGWSLDKVQEENLKLFKTGRTNANDGGIDFVMRPLGRFFQVTETLDIKKYLLDIDKIERYPISFVIKSEDAVDIIQNKLEKGARKQYVVEKIVKRYMNCIEEIINIPLLKERFKMAEQEGYLSQMLDEIVTQSKLEFNYDDDDGEDDNDD